MSDAQEKRIIDELMEEPDLKRMSATQEQAIARILNGMNFTHNPVIMKDLMWRIGASEHGWEWRMLTKRQANGLISLLERIAEGPPQ